MLLWFVAAVFFRRRFQFSLFSLCVLVVAVAIPCSWMAVEMGKAREQREAVEAIRELGGGVSYEHEPDDPFAPVAEPPAPAWLQNLLGGDFFTTVSVLYGSAQDTNAMLAHVKGLTHLNKLNLDCTQITDAGLEHLAGLTQLQSLSLHNTQVTDAGLAHLTRLPQLQWLGLEKSQVTDAGLANLIRLTQLQWLGLDNTQVTDAGLAHLAGLTQLQWLSLDKTQITDAGLAHLAGLTQLQRLWLDRTKVTDEGVKKLQQALPDCKIHH
jgi:Leucine-rich repeat (LRR) protein